MEVFVVKMVVLEISFLLSYKRKHHKSDELSLSDKSEK